MAYWHMNFKPKKKSSDEIALQHFLLRLIIIPFKRKLNKSLLLIYFASKYIFKMLNWRQKNQVRENPFFLYHFRPSFWFYNSHIYEISLAFCQGSVKFSKLRECHEIRFQKSFRLFSLVQPAAVVVVTPGF